MRWYPQKKNPRRWYRTKQRLASGQYTLSMRTYAPFRNVACLNQRHDSGNEVKYKKLWPLLGRESFDDTKENWETYVERVEQFFLANDIDDDHKVPTLLSLIGGKTYTLPRDLLAPEKPATKSFQQIVTTLREHWARSPWKLQKDFVPTRETNMKEKIFCLTWPS